ncbi:MAG: PmoA family protein [Puniceicoccales bacterium]|nr:PmoA family protein [Puniceicoccales bacterium]
MKTCFSLLTPLVFAATACSVAANTASVAAPQGDLPASVVGKAWTFHRSSGEGKAYFHPLEIPNAPSAGAFTAFRPADHKWHLGLWFSWKYLNGVNFWEPDKRARIRTEQSQIAFDSADENRDSPRFDLTILYEVADKRAAGGFKPMLRETRTVAVCTAKNGNSYTINWDASFTAEAEKVVFERTKPGRDKKGAWTSGGYAGLNFRFADEPAFRYEFTNAEGVKGAKSCGLASEFITAKITAKNGAQAQVSIRDLSAAAAGKAVAASVSPPPPVWFVRDQPGALKGRGYYVLGSAPVFHRPLTLKRGETLRLRYEITVTKISQTAP